MTVVAVIPARSGSKGVPGKNLVNLDGKPLISHQIENALAADEIGRTIVSTNDENIARAAEEHGADVPFIRPDELADDDVPVIAVYKHALEWLDSQGKTPNFLVGLQPTCPFTRPEEIDDAVSTLRETGCDSVVSVSKVTETHPYRSYIVDGNRLRPFDDITVDRPIQRQDRPTVYGLTGAIFARQPAVLREWDHDTFALGDDVRAVVQNDEQALDIDTPFELRLARALVEYEDPQ